VEVKGFTIDIPSKQFIPRKNGQKKSTGIHPPIRKDKLPLSHKGEKSNIANLSAQELIRDEPDSNEYIPRNLIAVTNA
jgi:hypothetical protein